MDSADSGSQLGREPVLENRENANLRPYTALSDTMAAGYTATALDSNQAVFQGSGIQHTGKGHFNVHGNVNITPNPPPDSREDEECMKALFVTDPSEDRAMLKRKKGNRASGTCEWIAQTEKLNTWLHFEETEQKSQSNNILWLHGNPGTGKSTMAIFLTEELSTSFHGKENMTLAYFFCDASFEKQKTATSIVRGLLYLLVQKHKNLLSRYILPKFKERGDQLFTSFDALWRVFLAAAADQDTGRKYCIIDALDECDNGSKEILLCQLHETFHCQEKPPPNLSILITSRPYPEIREYLQDFTNADLASFDQTRQDIDRCIRERVDGLAKKKNYTDKVKREIIDLLMDKAEGTFLWVGLACEELRGKLSKDAIQFLRDMPKGLISLYKSLLKTATEGETSECVAIRRILSFVAISFEALSVRALSEACQLHQDEPDMDTRLQYTRDQIASCRLLVVVYDQKVQLLHKSVRDFLTGSGSDFFVERLEAHASAASCCIDNLIKRLHDENPPEGPLLDYAIDYWTYHVREARERFRICEPQIPFFEANSTSMREWMQIICRYPSEFTFLHVALDLGLPILVEYALGTREVHPIMGGPAFNIRRDVNPLYESYESPLNTVLSSGKIDQKTGAKMVNMLLKAGAIVTIEDIKLAVDGSWADQEVVLSLLDHMHPETRIQYIQQLLRGSRGRENKFTLSILENQRRGQIIITEAIMERAAANEEQGSELVEFLLRFQGEHILITEKLMLSAIHNAPQGKRIIKLLCQHQSGKVIITTKILEAAVIREQGRECLELLLQHRGYQPTVTIKNYALLYGGVIDFGQIRENISFVFQKLGNSLNFLDLMTTAMKYFYHHEEFIEFLVQEGGAHIVITDEIMEAVSDANSPGYKHQIACMELFFKRRRQLRFTDKAFAIIREFVQNQLSESELSKDEEENLTTAGELEELLLEE
ncbi:hypothetical protein V8C43DRAFT_278617 [Trichoderma afarasin]